MKNSSNLSRRAFLGASGVAMLSLTLGGVPSFVVRAATALRPSTSLRKKTLICIFQRGAVDGLMAVPPLNDPDFNKARIRLAMRLGDDKGLIKLDENFALHPAFQSFVPMFREGRLAVVHAIGSPNSTRSHFDAQDYMESGTPGQKASEGWLHRAAQQLKTEATPFRSVACCTALPLSMNGASVPLVIDDLKQFRVDDSRAQNSPGVAQSFEALYSQSNQGLMAQSGSESVDALHTIKRLGLDRDDSSSAARYPKTSFGKHCQQVARMIRADIGLEIVFLESTGWDTHVQQGTVNGQFQRVASDFAQSISALWNDLGSKQDDVCIMTMTEFGRTVKENGSGGRDHGRGSCMFVLSNAVNGGHVHGNLPRLAPENLADGRDVPVTTDFRALFSAVAAQHLSIAHPQNLFPGWNGTPINIMRS